MVSDLFEPLHVDTNHFCLLTFEIPTQNRRLKWQEDNLKRFGKQLRHLPFRRQPPGQFSPWNTSNILNASSSPVITVAEKHPARDLIQPMKISRQGSLQTIVVFLEVRGFTWSKAEYWGSTVPIQWTNRLKDTHGRTSTSLLRSSCLSLVIIRRKPSGSLSASVKYRRYSRYSNQVRYWGRRFSWNAFVSSHFAFKVSNLLHFLKFFLYFSY